MQTTMQTTSYQAPHTRLLRNAAITAPLQVLAREVSRRIVSALSVALRAVVHRLRQIALVVTSLAMTLSRSHSVGRTQ